MSSAWVLLGVAGSCDCVQYPSWKHRLHWGSRARWQPFKGLQGTQCCIRSAAETSPSRPAHAHCIAATSILAALACIAMSNTAKHALHADGQSDNILYVCRHHSPEFSLARAAESVPHRVLVHSFSTESVEPMAPTLLMLPIRIVAQTGIQNRGVPDGAWKLISAVAAEVATAAFCMMYIDFAQRSRSVLQEGNTQVETMNRWCLQVAKPAA